MANTLTLRDIVGFKVNWHHGDASGFATLIHVANLTGFALSDKGTNFYLPFTAANAEIFLNPVFEVQGLFQIDLHIGV